MLHVDQTAPGGWLAATAPGRLVVVRAPEPAAELIERLWSALAGGVQPVLDVLTSRGLAATPGFALAEWSGAADHGFEVRFIVRGAARVEVEADEGARSIDASRVSTWIEQPVSAVRAFRVACDDDAEGGAVLPLGLGAAWVRGVVFGGDRSTQVAEADLADADLAIADVSAPAAQKPVVSAPVVSTPIAPDPAASAPAASESVASVPEPIADVTVVEPFGDEAEADDEIEMDDEADEEGEDASGTAEADPSGRSAGASPEEGSTPESDAAPTDYDQLFGATIVRSVEEAAVRPVDDEDASAPTPAHAITPPPFVAGTAAPDAGDHDGFTVLSGDIDALRTSRDASGGPALPPPAAPSFHLQLAGGAKEPLTGTVIVGRAPSVSQVPGTRVPHLVTVDTPDHDISRNHVQFTLEGDTVVVTDLHSRNGTMIVLPGKAPQKLRQGEPTSVIVGTVVDLGGGVTLTVGQG